MGIDELTLQSDGFFILLQKRIVVNRLAFPPEKNKTESS